MPMPDILLFLALSSVAAPQSAAATASEPIFEIEEIAFTQDCNPNHASQRIVDMMTGDGVDLRVFQSVSGEMEHRLHLDAPADWHGLKLAGVHLYFGIEWGPVNYALIFND